MNNKKRAAGFLIIGAVYAAAVAFGIWLYLLLPLPMPLSLLIADVGATLLVFVFSNVFKNASVYDPYWSVQPIVIVGAFLIFSELTVAKALVSAAVFYWGARLTANWAYTFHGLEFEDWRYRMLREKTGAFYPFVNLTGIHMVPTLIVYGCTLPAVYIITETSSTDPLCLAGFAVSVLAATLQLVSDIQMHRYRKNRTSPFIRVGLWKHSRHPNYLGEILMHWGVALMALCLLPSKWYLIFGAVTNTVLFLVVSIPMADKRQSRKAGFEEYKRETRMLLPIPR